MSRPNALDAQFPDPDPDDPEGYGAREAPYGKQLGGEELTVRLYMLPPGQALCPYHYEYVEEWLIVMTGEVQVRTPTGTQPAHAGDLLRFPKGPDGAHKVINQSDEPARIVMFSSNATPAVAVYPDSDKVGVWTDNGQDEFMFRRPDAKVAYFDGELEAPTG